MHVFSDKTGQDWTVELTVGAISRIRAESEGRFNLWDPAKDNLAATLSDDLPTFWELLWYLCSAQAKQRNLTAVTFGELMADEVLLVAQQKFFADWREFFQRCGRDPQAVITATAAKANAKALELVRAKLTPQTLSKIDQAIDAKLSSTLNGSLSSLEQLLGMTLEASPSDNLLGPLAKNRDTLGS